MRFLRTLLFLVLSAPSLAQSPPPKCTTTSDQRAIRALNNVQAEITNCIVYYNFIVRCTPLDDSVYAARKKELEEIIEDQMKFAHLIGQKICMTEDAMLARVELDTKRLGKIIQDSCVNLDSLTKLYADRCKFVVENADAVLNEYIKK